MHRSLTLVLGLVALAAVASVVYGRDPSNSGTTTIGTSIPTNGAPFRPAASVNDTNGIRLTLSLNATSLSAGQSIGISLVGYNTLSESNYVNESDRWPSLYVSDGPCGTGNLPLGYSIFAGYYTAANASSSEPLNLYAPGGYNCPLMILGIRGYGFAPANSTAEVYAACTPEPCLQIEASVTATIAGYWSSTQPGVSVQSFPPGVYTVIGADEWGDLALLHFTVS